VGRDVSYGYKEAIPKTPNWLRTADATNCPITSCELQYNNGINGLQYFGGVFATIAKDVSDGLFYISYKTDVTTDYSIKLWVKCSNGYGSGVTRDGYTFAQSHPCIATLTAKTLDPETFVYPFERDLTNMGVFRTEPISTFIVSSDTVLCPITSCETWDTRSLNSVAKTFEGISTYDSTGYGAWVVSTSVSRNTVGDKSSYLRVQCTQGTQTIKSNKFTLKQTANPCLGTLTGTNTVPINLTGVNALSYQVDTSNYVSAGNWDSVFTNSKPEIAACAETCSIKHYMDCSSPGDPMVTLSDSKAPTLVVRQNMPEGYEATVCIKCANLDTSITKQFSVKQILRCHNRLSNKSKVVEANVDNTDDEGVLRYKRDPILPAVFMVRDRSRPKTYTTFVADVFDRFFVNQEEDIENCPVNSCELMKPGCMVAADSDNVRINLVGGKWAFQSHLDKPYGYIENFCIKCSNSDAMYQRQDITYDNYLVTLPSKCTYAMEERLTTDLEPIDQTHIYIHDDTRDNKIFANGFEQFFVNVGGKHGIDNNMDEEQCPIIKCELKAKGCKAEFDGGDGANVVMAETAPWAVTIKDNNFNAYTDNICVQCDNEYQIIQFDQLKITQTGRCIDKLDSKVLTTNGKSDPLGYISEGADTVFAASWKSYMTNTDVDQTKCMVENC